MYMCSYSNVYFQCNFNSKYGADGYIEEYLARQTADRYGIDMVIARWIVALEEDEEYNSEDELHQKRLMRIALFRLLTSIFSSVTQ